MTARKLSTKWKKGESGNPAGRPKGSGLTGTLRRAIQDRAPEVVQVLVDAALAGDTQAARILLDRIMPVLKAEAAPVELPALADGTLTERAQAALAAVAEGTLAPDVAGQLVAAVAGLARVEEITELQDRIVRLEELTETTTRNTP